jgi:hypothetical protein
VIQYFWTNEMQDFSILFISLLSHFPIYITFSGGID